ncbi:unnamed protein product [Hyaloperonospora brassicae]|uniref:RING-type E3 ubiquitin transferase n=1 Tax=Hyaloperonospora brassicae TaxID=162125 RepID=A0AAV0T8B1_HYABA|nr:unnamed protein product [Hyaloperonospora brassicae]
MSASTSNTSEATSATHTQESSSSRGSFVFVLPPPPTIWIHFNDGTRMAFTPSPAQYLQSVLHGAPVFGSPPPTSGGASTDASANSADAFLTALNELFQRAQEQQQHGPPPTSKGVLDKLPVKLWTASMQTTERHAECVICLSDYETDDEVLALPCGHTFHKECGLTWLVQHNVCPTCRFELPTEGQADNGSLAVVAPPAATSASEHVSSSEDLSISVTGVRRQRPTETFHPRDVRQRMSDSRALTSVTTGADEAELDRMLEQEADRFVKEEMETSRVVVNSGQDDGVEIEDGDVEELLSESATTVST